VTVPPPMPVGAGGSPRRTPSQIAAGISPSSPRSHTSTLGEDGGDDDEGGEFLALRSCCIKCQKAHSVGLLPDDLYNERWSRAARKKRKKDLDELNATEAEAKERGEREADEDRSMKGIIDVDEVDKVPVDQRRASREGDEEVQVAREIGEGEVDGHGGEEADATVDDLAELATNSLGLDIHDDGNKGGVCMDIDHFSGSSSAVDDDEDGLPLPPRLPSISPSSPPAALPSTSLEPKRKLSWASVGRGLSSMRGSLGGVSSSTVYAAGCF
jgi:hypothetical protein